MTFARYPILVLRAVTTFAIAIAGAGSAHAQTVPQPNIAAACAQESAQAGEALNSQAQNAQTALNNAVKNPAPAATQACLQTDFANFDLGQGFNLGGILGQVANQVVTQSCAALSGAINNTVNSTVMQFNGQVQQITALPANLGGQLANGASGQITSLGGAANQAVQQPVMQAQGTTSQAASNASGFFGNWASKIGSLFH